jgi:hypothetical protein
LQVSAGARVILDIGPNELTVPGLLLAPSSRIDIGVGRLTVATGLTEAFVQSLLLDGLNGGGWDGSSGIVSRAAAANGRTVGYVVDQDTVTIAYAAAGDTNLDGVVDVIDIANLVASFNGTGAGWSHGDFNYDGVVDQLDLADFLVTALFDQGGYLTPTEAAFASFHLEDARADSRGNSAPAPDDVVAYVRAVQP